MKMRGAGQQIGQFTHSLCWLDRNAEGHGLAQKPNYAKLPKCRDATDRARCPANPQVFGSSPGRGATEHKSPQTKVCGLFRF